MKGIKKSRFISLRGVGVAATALICATAPSLSFAGGGGGVVLGPVSATAVPALTPAVLIALGGLLAVIGFRVLQHNGARKVFSLGLLASGVLVGGLGVEKTVATSARTLMEADCSTAEIIVETGNLRGISSPNNAVNNQCGRDLQIKEYLFTCTGPSEFDDNGAPVGTVIPDGAEQSLGYCASLIDEIG